MGPRSQWGDTWFAPRTLAGSIPVGSTIYRGEALLGTKKSGVMNLVSITTVGHVRSVVRSMTVLEHGLSHGLVPGE